ncbi:PKH4B protein, partial [Polypterus senegalus]
MPFIPSRLPVGAGARPGRLGGPEEGECLLQTEWGVRPGTNRIRVRGRSTGSGLAASRARQQQRRLRSRSRCGSRNRRSHNAAKRHVSALGAGEARWPRAGGPAPERHGLAGVSCVPADDWIEAGPRNASLVSEKDPIGPEGVAQRRQAPRGADRQVSSPTPVSLSPPAARRCLGGIPSPVEPTFEELLRVLVAQCEQLMEMAVASRETPRETEDRRGAGTGGRQNTAGVVSVAVPVEQVGGFAEHGRDRLRDDRLRVGDLPTADAAVQTASEAGRSNTQGLDSEALDSCIQNTLSVLYPPFEATAATVLCQVFDVVEKTYRGDGLRYLTDFLVPSKHILQCIQQDACFHYCGYIFRHEGWPLCIHEKVIVHLASLDWRRLKPGDFYLQIVPYLKKTPRIVLKCLSTDKHNIEELEVPDVMYTSIFTKEWLELINRERMGTSLEYCLLSTDSTIFRVPWKEIVCPEFISRPEITEKTHGMNQTGATGFEKTQATQTSVLPNFSLSTSEDIVEHNESEETDLSRTRHSHTDAVNMLDICDNMSEKSDQDLEGDYVELADISFPRFCPQKGSLTESLCQNYRNIDKNHGLERKEKPVPDCTKSTCTQSLICKNLIDNNFNTTDSCEVSLRTISNGQQKDLNGYVLCKNRTLNHVEGIPSTIVSVVSASDSACYNPNTFSGMGSLTKDYSSMFDKGLPVHSHSSSSDSSLNDAVQSSSALGFENSFDTLQKYRGIPDNDSMQSESTSKADSLISRDMSHNTSDIQAGENDSLVTDTVPVSSTEIQSERHSFHCCDKDKTRSAFMNFTQTYSPTEENRSSPSNVSKAKLPDITLGFSSEDIASDEKVCTGEPDIIVSEPYLASSNLRNTSSENLKYSDAEYSKCMVDTKNLSPAFSFMGNVQYDTELSSREANGDIEIVTTATTQCSFSGLSSVICNKDDSLTTSISGMCVQKENCLQSTTYRMEEVHLQLSVPTEANCKHSVEEDCQRNQSHADECAYILSSNDVADVEYIQYHDISDGLSCEEYSSDSHISKSEEGSVNKGKFLENGNLLSTIVGQQKPEDCVYICGIEPSEKVAQATDSFTVEATAIVAGHGASLESHEKGTRDKCGRGVVIITTRNTVWLNPSCNSKELVNLLLYFYAILRKDVQAMGLTVLVDARRCSPVPALFKAFNNVQVELLTSLKSLHKHIDGSQLPLEFDGTFPFCYSDWVSFRMKLEQLTELCETASTFLCQIIESLRSTRVPSTAEKAEYALKEYKDQMKNILEDKRLVMLQLEGGSILSRLKKEESCVSLTDNYRDEIETAMSLYNKVDELVHCLVMLSNKHMQELEFVVEFKTLEEGFKKEYCKTGEKLLKKLEEYEDISSSELQVYEVKVHSFWKKLKDFSQKVEDTREWIDKTVKLYEFFDKAYEWALEGMRRLASITMEDCSMTEKCGTVIKCLEEYRRQHPDISEAKFLEMKELACELKSEKCQKQWKFAWSKCQETKQMFEKKLEAALRTRRSLPLGKIACDVVGSAGRRYSEGTNHSMLYERSNSISFSSSQRVFSSGWSRDRLGSHSSTGYYGVASGNVEDSSAECVFSTTPILNRHAINQQISGTATSLICRVSPDSYKLTRSVSADEPNRDTQPRIQTRTSSCSSASGTGYHGKRQLRKTQSFDVAPSEVARYGTCQRTLSEPARHGNTGVFIKGLEVSSTEIVERPYYRQQTIQNWTQGLAEGCRNNNPIPDSRAKSSKLRHIIEEMVMTERDYVRSLRYIIDNYFPEMERCDLPQDLRGKRSIIFGNLEKLYDFHSQYFLKELESCCNHPLRVSHCFLRHQDQFGMYALYSKNKPKSDSLLASHGNIFFRFKQLQLEDKMDLASYLLKPIQRMSKYALLLKDLFKECSEAQEQELSYLRAAAEMVKFQLRHGNDLLAMDAIRDCDTADVGLTENCGESGMRFEIWFRRRKSKNQTYVLQASTPEIKQAWTTDVAKILWQQATRNKGARTRASIAVSLFDHSDPFKRTQTPISATGSPIINSSSSSSLLGPLNLHMYTNQSLMSGGVLTTDRPFCISTCIEEDEQEHETSSQPSMTTESSESSSHCMSGSGSSGSDSGCVSSILPENLSEEPGSPCDMACYSYPASQHSSSATSPLEEKAKFSNSQYISAVSIVKRRVFIQ